MSLAPRTRTGLALRLAVGLLAAVALPASAHVVISQAYGGGGNSGATWRQDFIELRNTGSSPVSLDNWSVQYASTTGSSWQVTNLAGVIQPGGYYLVQQAQGAGGTQDLPTPDVLGSISMGANGFKVALVASRSPLSGACPIPANADVRDFVGVGGANCFEGTAPTAATSAANAAVRKAEGAQDTNDNRADFDAAAPTPRNSAGGASGQPTDPVGSGSAQPGNAAAGANVLLAVRVTPGANPASTGVAVRIDLSAFGGSATQAMNDAGADGDAAAGDGTYSTTVTIPADAVAGDRTLPFAISDAEGRTGTGTIRVGVVGRVAIHAIQGNGARSPILGQVVITEGIVTARKFNGFFVQTATGEDDGDASTSEGLFVFTGTNNVPATAQVGSRVRVGGTVAEFGSGNSGTQLTGPSVERVLADQPLPAAVDLASTTALRPDSALDALERYEGMRVSAAELVAVSGTGATITESTATVVRGDGAFFAVLPGVARPFREPGLAANDDVTVPATKTNVPRFDTNPERLRVDTDALEGTAALTLDAGAVVRQAEGVLDVDAGNAALLTGPGLVLASAGPGPRPAPAAGYDTITVAGANLLRFFDTTDDAGVGDVRMSPQGYAFRLAATARVVCEGMGTPDIVGVVEVETLVALQGLADAINTGAVPNPDDANAPLLVPECDAAPAYAAYLEEGNDPGGIDVGFLVSTREVAAGRPRVQVRAITQVGKADRFTPPGGSEQVLNDRPPLVLEATVFQEDGEGFDLTVVANHLRSLNNSVGNDAAAGRARFKRAEQAVFLANYLAQRQAANPDERVLLLGDFNAFEFNDGYVDVMGIITGRPAAEDAVLEYRASALEATPLTNLVLATPAADRYGYSFDGNAQNLDHIVVNEALRADASVAIEHPRVNADFAGERFGTRGGARVSDHDPVVAYISVPAFRRGDFSLAIDAEAPQVDAGETAAFRVRVGNGGPSPAPLALELAFAAAPGAIRTEVPAGWTCDAPQAVAAGSVLVCATEAQAAGSADLRVLVDTALAAGAQVVGLQGVVSSEVVDRSPGNDAASAQVEVLAVALADLAVRIDVPGLPLRPNASTIVLATVANRGPQAAPGTRLAITADAPAARIKALAAPGWRCDSPRSIAAARSEITCETRAALPSGALGVILLQLKAPGSRLPGVLGLEATVDSDRRDPDTRDNRDEASIRLLGLPG